MPHAFTISFYFKLFYKIFTYMLLNQAKKRENSFCLKVGENRNLVKKLEKIGTGHPD